MDKNDPVGAIIAAAVATVIAILSGIGVGSGGLLVIWLTLIEGMGINDARSFNLLFFVFSASAALVFHILRKRLIPRLVVVLALFACVGTLVGTYLGTVIDSGIIRRVFGGMLTLSGLYTLFGRRREK
jgi:uncharacterized membrane protein YfcA